ncbi:conserved exported hypothetical protein [Rubrivivax sp. A210]|uniref:hypothetical protein n=1 Tax=Rubrivivax sp. A210 TaxID=2772301 RepID=UPI001918B18B|nr:hypothetical protein [Rubrivivax sp. A210]CAD5371982.1 conserved exported hypothetical protein [Rubrivivax sp. A210]
MTIKKSALALALLATTTLASAQSWRLFPLFTDPNHKLEPTLALTAGSVSPDGGSDASTVGLELSFNCGLIQSPDNRIRSYLKMERADKNGVESTQFELSPRYTVPLGGNVVIGAGPSLTAVKLSAPGLSKTVYGGGVAAGLDWRMGRLYAGVDLRWHDTSAKDGAQFDNTAVAVKVGFNF